MPNITAPLTARPTIYKGIEMRSRLEAKWAAYWDLEKDEQAGDGRVFTWRYEPFCFASGTSQYLPDFELRWAESPIPTYADVKPFIKNPLPLMEKMEIIWHSSPHADLRIDVGDPLGDERCYECQRFHPFGWHEWHAVDNGDLIRESPEPEWFKRYRDDALAIQAFEAGDWETLHELEDLYFRERVR